MVTRTIEGEGEGVKRAICSVGGETAHCGVFGNPGGLLFNVASVDKRVHNVLMIAVLIIFVDILDVSQYDCIVCGLVIEFVGMGKSYDVFCCCGEVVFLFFGAI